MASALWKSSFIAFAGSQVIHRMNDDAAEDILKLMALRRPSS